MAMANLYEWGLPKQNLINLAERGKIVFLSEGRVTWDGFRSK